ncbi:hypothetical protein [Thalassotalea euphylliae]|uniref:hypothetical protein n=1 Tax=Thalassotalea euphylliae TaxID=1655234 RepID=UPI0015F24FB7|nr:hypothetical protein [Thalassotalea euphylliae]
MEILALAAAILLIWMAWQLYRAKSFNRFKREIMTSLKPKVLAHLEQRLIEERSELTPNNQAHIDASQFYWGQYPSRVLQAALHWQIIDDDWLVRTGNKRYSQHLFFVEQDKLAEFTERLTSEVIEVNEEEEAR